MDNPAITVFMAAYNGSKFIAESIQSVLDQQFENFELLIIDDGSTDDQVQIIKNFSDKRITLLKNDQNNGLTFTRNKGLCAARGKYIAILDSDDIALPDRLSIQYQYMEANPEVVVCGGQASLIDGEGKEIGAYPFVPTGKKGLNVHLLFRDIFINPTCMMVKKVVINEGGYREFAPAEDFDLYVRLAYKYPVANLNKTLIKYRIHETNVSISEDSIVRQQEQLIIKNMLLKLSINPSNHLLAVHHSLYLRKLEKFSAFEYYKLIAIIKQANEALMVYDQQVLKNYLTKLWNQLLKDKKISCRKIRSLFFQFKLAAKHYVKNAEKTSSTRL